MHTAQNQRTWLMIVMLIQCGGQFIFIWHCTFEFTVKLGGKMKKEDAQILKSHRKFSIATWSGFIFTVDPTTTTALLLLHYHGPFYTRWPRSQCFICSDRLYKFVMCRILACIECLLQCSGACRILNPVAGFHSQLAATAGQTLAAKLVNRRQCIEGLKIFSRHC